MGDNTLSPDGRRVSINVEILGGSLVVQHYIEEVARPDHLRLVSTPDVFTPTGRTKISINVRYLRFNAGPRVSTEKLTPIRGACNRAVRSP